MTKPADLAALRAELDELDHELLRVARRRLEVVAQVKAAKAATGKHLFDRQREQVVFRRAETSGQALGLDPGLARDLIARLVEASHTVQEGRAPAETAGDARRLLIIGGRGKMGAMLGHQFAARGHSVEVIEKDEALDRGKVEKADIVMIAVPMQVAVAVTKAVAPLVRTDVLLCDINSLKTDVCRALATSRGEALGMHPMFGPTVASLRRQKVVLCEVKSGPHSAWLAAQW
ncbi:MAG: prephenate dehydrogenase/arogenate dehydrogenase family protein, partial [Myxococcota bacterium]